MTRTPETIEEIPWDGESAAPGQVELWTVKPIRCRHPRDRRMRVQGGWVCECGHAVADEKVRRGRAVRKYGKKEELADARLLGIEPRGTSRDQEDSGGSADPVVVQSKTGPGFYPRPPWIRELDELGPVANGRPRILVTTPKTGPGVKRRKVAVMFLDELIELAGLGKEK